MIQLDRGFKVLVVATFGLLAFGCSSKPITPDKSAVKVAREAPPEKCKLIGKVAGQTMSAKGTAQEALDDMIKDAANRGADYLQVLEYSGNGTAVTGMAYTCP